MPVLRLPFLACALSVATVIMGLVAVVIVISQQVVPRYRLQTMAYRKCLIANITVVNLTGDCGKELEVGSSTSQDLQLLDNSCFDTCVSIRVEYNVIKADYRVLNIHKKQQREVGFLQPIKNNSRSTSSLRTPCFCKDCVNMDAAEIRRFSYKGASFHVGKSLRCFTESYHRHPSSSSNSGSRADVHLNVRLFLAMIVPSCVFILGFVGTFFSCLFIMKDSLDSTHGDEIEDVT